MQNQAVCSERRQAMVAEMKRMELDVVIATGSASFYYFTGVGLESGERACALIFRRNGEVEWVVHEMFQHEAAESGVKLTLWKDGQSAYPLIAAGVTADAHVAIDGGWQARHVIGLMGELSKSVSLISADPIFAAIRACKDATEVSLMEYASELADNVVGRIRDFIKPGVKESDIVHQLEKLWKESGAEGMSFAPIIAAGTSGASPHHEPDDSVLTAGTTVIVDTGGIHQHYCSDTTRTFILGEPTTEMKEVYECVLQAQLAGIAIAKPGVTLGDVDAAVRKVITDTGYGAYFTHRTGHGVGIEIHEAPYVVGGNEEVLKAGMVITIEPGIYLPGKFGVRIEDTVIVEENGARPLNKSPKSFQDMILSV